ncbi:Omp28-related outer membrane protein [Flavobacterium rakeshii]|uniref:Omp28-related outer membrane protein n=1 Tax=Flavobacterium rakeshii TaxID=1038845 RepID=A0A6N8HGL6_9FLAO|nr:Omp28-related outer membrane protein [Flavobacterium rakeshii]MEE1897591.1 Omp28-related outer membrane protein [Flavobacterium rakeshii]MUV04818.1 Omp28-related outer membrane protein [Flavobacterium rakeshii]
MKRILFSFFSVLALILSSCSSDYLILDSVEEHILTADFSSREIGYPITFTVRNSDGEDVTSLSTIYIDGNAIEGNTFTSETVETFEVTAKYSGLLSKSISIYFHDGTEINFKKRLLIEDYTGTWCGYCPRVAHAIELVKDQTENVVAVAIHRASLSPASANYDPYTYDSTELENLLGAAGYPKGYLNRFTKWQALENNNIAQAVNLTQGENPKLGLALSSTVDNGNINIDVNVKFGKDFNELKLVVYVLENGLIHEQHNYTTFYGGDDVLEDFEHNHVLRECITPLLGEAITGNLTIANTFTKSFNVPVPANVENAANLEFVAFVTDAEGNALNVRSNHPGEAQEFEEL